jgi:hypothetical protein
MTFPISVVCRELTPAEADEYESVAETMAKRGLKGEIDDVLPMMIRDQVAHATRTPSSSECAIMPTD